MYRITIYDNDGTKTVDEMNDEDELRSRIDDCKDDIENKIIKTFSVSWLSSYRHQEKWWEK
jgi:hypothetical protein